METCKVTYKKGYSKIKGLLDIDGPYAKFYTPHLGVGGKSRHEIDVDLNLLKTKKKK